MKVELKFNVNPSLYLRDPESSEIGRSILKNAIDLIFEIGYENFTFKKLAQSIYTTEATIYRYFPNKHKLLLYLINWYWNFLYYQTKIQLKSKENAKEQLEIIIQLISNTQDVDDHFSGINLQKLYALVVVESSKVYLVKEVDEINKEQAFKPYKELCAYIAEQILAYSPKYKYPKSLASTIMETAHTQLFFSAHLPKLTDNQEEDHSLYVRKYIENLLFSVLK